MEADLSDCSLCSEEAVLPRRRRRYYDYDRHSKSFDCEPRRSIHLISKKLKYDHAREEGLLRQELASKNSLLRQLNLQNQLLKKTLEEKLRHCQEGARELTLYQDKAREFEEKWRSSHRLNRQLQRKLEQASKSAGVLALQFERKKAQLEKEVQLKIRQTTHLCREELGLLRHRVENEAGARKLLEDELGRVKAGVELERAQLAEMTTRRLNEREHLYASQLRGKEEEWARLERAYIEKDHQLRTMQLLLDKAEHSRPNCEDQSELLSFLKSEMQKKEVFIKAERERFAKELAQARLGQEEGLSMMRARLQDCENQLSRLMQNLVDESRANSRMGESAKALQQEKLNLERQLERVRQEYRQFRAHCDMGFKGSLKLGAEHEQLLTVINGLRGEHQFIKQKLAKSQEELESARKNVDLLSRERNELQMATQHLSLNCQRSESVRRQAADLFREKEHLAGMLAEESRLKLVLKEKLHQSQKQIDLLDAKLKALEADEVKRTQQGRGLESEANELRQEVARVARLLWQREEQNRHLREKCRDMTEGLADYEGELAGLKLKFVTIREEIKRKDSKIAQLELQLRQVNQKENSSERRLNKVQAELDAKLGRFTELNDELKEQLMKTKEARARLLHQLEDKESALQQVLRTNNSLEQQLQQTRQEAAQLGKSLAEKSSLLNQGKSATRSLELQYENMAQQLGYKESVLGQMKHLLMNERASLQSFWQQEREKEAIRARLQSQLNLLEQQLAEARRQAQQCKEQLKRVRRQLEQGQVHYATQVRQLIEECNQSKAEAASARGKLDQLKAKLGQRERESELNQRRLAQSQSKLKNKTDDYNQLKQKYTELQRSAKDYDQLLEAQQSSDKEYKSKIDALRRQAQSARAENETLVQEQRRVQLQVYKMELERKHLEERLKQRQAPKQADQEELLQLRNQVRSREERLVLAMHQGQARETAFLQEINQLKLVVAQLEEQRVLLLDEAKSLKRKVRRRDEELVAEQLRLKEVEAQSQLECQDLRAKLKRAEEDNRQLKEQNGRQAEAMAQAELERNRQREGATALTLRLQQYQRSASEYREQVGRLKAEQSQLSKEHSKCGPKINQLNCQNESLKQQLSKLEEDVEAVERELEKERNTYRERNARYKHRHKKEIESLRKELGELSNAMKSVEQQKMEAVSKQECYVGGCVGGCGSGYCRLCEDGKRTERYSAYEPTEEQLLQQIISQKEALSRRFRL